MTAKRWQPSEAEMKRFIREFFKNWAHLEGIEARLEGIRVEFQRLNDNIEAVNSLGVSKKRKR